MGTYYQTCTANYGYTFNGECRVAWKIVKADTSIRLNNQSYEYIESQTAPTVSATLTSRVTNNNITNASVSYKYYNNTNCSGIEISKPKVEGAYSVKATFGGTSNYNASSSSCSSYIIKKNDGIGYISEFKYMQGAVHAAFGSAHRYKFKISGPKLSSTSSNIAINRIYFCLDDKKQRCSQNFEEIIANGKLKNMCNTGRTVYDEMNLSYYAWTGSINANDNNCNFNSGSWYFYKGDKMDGLAFDLILPGTEDNHNCTWKKGYYLCSYEKMNFVLVKVKDNNCSGSNCDVTKKSCVIQKETRDITSKDYTGSYYSCN